VTCYRSRIFKKVKDQNLLEWITALPTVSYYKASGHHRELWLKTDLQVFFPILMYCASEVQTISVLK